MAKFKVTLAKTYEVEAVNKERALFLAKMDDGTLFTGEWTSAKELPKEETKGWSALTKQQLTGR